MTLGTGILGEVILGDGDSVSGTPTPTPTPTPTSTSKYISIVDTGVKIQSGNTSTVIDFIAVDADGDLLTDLTGFSVVRRRGNGAPAAMTTPTVTQVNKILMPGVYSLLCDEDTTLAHGIDEQTITYRITHASISPQTLQAVIYRPKITPGSTLNVEITTGKVDITDDGILDIASVIVAVEPDNDTIAAINDYLNTEIPNLQSSIPELVDGRMPSDVGAIGGDNQAAVNLRNHALMAAPVTFLAGGTTTTAILDTIGGEALNNASNVIYRGASFVFTAPASLKNQRAYIQSYDASSGEVVISEVAVAVGVSAKAILV